MPLRQLAGVAFDAHPAELDGSSALKVVAERYGLERSDRLGREERSGEQVGLERFTGAGPIPTRRSPCRALSFHLLKRILGHGVQIDTRDRDLEHGLFVEQVDLSPLPVPRLQVRAHALVVSGQRLVRGGWDSVGNDLGIEDPDQAVSQRDLRIQERQRLARLDRLDPERGLAELDGERVPVDAVDAVPYDLAERALPRLLVLHVGARVDARDLGGEPARGGQQEMA